MIQTPSRIIPLEDFLRCPETKPASEYIDGQIIQKPMPQGEHSTLQRVLTRDIDNALSPSKIAHAYPELRCTFGGRSLVPDISVFRWEHIPRQPNGRVANRFDLHPDWTIEILSPDQSQTKVTQNILHCLEHGTEMGWMIDSEESCIFTYQPNQTPRFFDRPEIVLPVPAFAKAIELTVKQLFDWLTD
ncbi:Uma2 family endonuclease [Tumidithrix elongata RA019]|uniref:Uma2 family endonuclease n=1 Tax=Tumidithrix elongata BACA0141 TaxID=2716417 RepID=A0AAW9PXF9_9CYAN|nr:Uma2 family endonuclease [Tumidithrix elongata RA019]